MIPAPFDYVRATSVDEAIALLAEHGEDAKLLAGGHSLLPLMRLRLAEPTALIDLTGIADLSYVDADDGTLRVGALTRHRVLERSALVAERAPLLAHAAGLVGDPQVRNRGTLGGSLAHADPAADLPAVLLALGGTVVARGPGGEREIPAVDFFVDFWETALGADEVLTEVRIPDARGRGWSYQKFAPLAQAWATVGVAVVDRAEGCAVSMANMGRTPLRAGAAEAALAGGEPGATAAAAAADGTSPPTDLHADADYRRHLARVLCGRALAEAGR